MGITNQNHLKSKHTKYKSITVKKIDRLQTVFINNTWLKLAKNQAKAKQHPEAELLLFENYSLASSMLSSKTNMRYSKKCAKNKRNPSRQLHVQS